MLERIVVRRWPAALALLAALAVVAKDLAGGRSDTTTVTYDGWLRAFAVARLLLAGIALLILTKRTLTRADVLLFTGIVGLSLEIFWEFVPGSFFWPAAVLAQAAVAFGMAQLVRYASAAGSGAPSRSAGIVALAAGITIALAGFLPILLGFGQLPDGRALDEATFLSVAPWLDRVRWLGMLTACAAIAAFTAIGLRRAHGEARPRAQFIVLSFAPLVLATSVHALVHVLGARDAAWARDADAVGTVLTAAGLAYGALTRRLVDIEYALSAAITLTLAAAALAVLAFSGEHYVVPVLAEHVASIAVLEPFGEEVRSAAHVAVAFAVFLIIGAIHERTKELVRGAIFAHREEHLQALRELAENAVEHAQPKSIAQALVGAAVAHAAAAHAALYVRDGSAFRLVAQAGSGSAARSNVSNTDPNVPPLRRPHVAPDGSLSLPMPLGTSLRGFLVCAPKENGLEYAPDEVAALALATREAGLVLATRA